MPENRCRFCLEDYPVPSMTRFCEERHLKAMQSIRGVFSMGLMELKNFIGGELTARIEKAVLGTLTLQDHVKGRIWRWENPNLQDILVLISLGIPSQLLEDIERVERKREGAHIKRRLQGLSSEPEKVIAELLM